MKAQVPSQLWEDQELTSLLSYQIVRLGISLTFQNIALFRGLGINLKHLYG